jgi:hypothetical protein
MQCNETETISIAQILRQKKDFLNYKVVHHCIKCGSRIETIWNGYEIDGNFISGDAWWSEVLDCVVNDPQDIICYNCLNSKERNLARFRKLL